MRQTGSGRFNGTHAAARWTKGKGRTYRRDELLHCLNPKAYAVLDSGVDATQLSELSKLGL